MSVLMSLSKTGRRAVLHAGVGGFVWAGLLLSGCASGPKAPPAPTLPLARVGLLTIGARPPSGEAVPFRGQAANMAGTMLFIGPTVMQLAVPASRREFASAVASVPFDPEAAFRERLLPALLAQGLPVTHLPDHALAQAVRAGNFKSVPEEFDALLDLQINGSGYYPASNAGGYSPMMYVVARLLMRSKPGEELARFAYDADYRSAEGESRFFTTPKTISAGSAEAIRAKGELIRVEMDSIAARMVDRMVIDIGRRIRNEPALP
jgi:hypothetical protein